MIPLQRAARLALFIVFMALATTAAPAITLTNPIVFVTQPPIPRELNSSVSNTFLSVVTIFGNQLADTAHAARGGDLWLMLTNTALINLTRKAGFGTNGVQNGIGIDVRDPQIHWGGKKVLFSMVVGAPVSATDTNTFYWQLYELTNLEAVIASTNTKPLIIPVPNQPTNYNNINPCYATDGRIIFTSDRPYNNQLWLYPQRDEYKGAASVTGIFSLDPVSGDLRMLEHLPSGAFNPFIDSFGRLLVTRWDHLVQDSSATGDRLGSSTNGAFNFSSEAANASVQANPIETFPEPVDFDTNYAAQLGVTVNGFNLFMPWALDPNGGNEEILNHVGRHELVQNITPSFTADPNLIAVTNYAKRTSYGIATGNTNFFNEFFQITEDPRHPGTYFGVDASDISPFGGTHSAGQILTLTGGMGLNPTGMVVSYITPKSTASPQQNSLGVFRNPLPMSDGTLIAAYTPTPNSPHFGFDYNLGTAAAPVAQYQFRLVTLTNTGSSWTTNQFLTGGITNTSIYWDGATLVANTATQWEIEAVEVRARPVPTPVSTPVAPVEQQVFAEEGVDLTTFQADLTARGVALVVSRNVTARDAADKQQPYNLAVPGGAQTVGTNSGKTYNITHLQFLQADYLRGYTYGTASPQPGRRVLAVPLHANTNLNYPSSHASAPAGGTELMSDGSQATFIPAGRAITWQLTGVTNESIVKERYWLNFRAGEVRTCANCHGINAVDQAGRPAPTNAPFALRQLLRQWRTNSANARLLTVSNGTGGGNFGAGSILTLTANAAPSGQYFAGWSGASVSNAMASTTLFIMPTNTAGVTAVFSNLPAPVFGSYQFTPGATHYLLTGQALASQWWILQSSTNLLNWVDVVSNVANGAGLVQFTPAATTNISLFFRMRSP